MLRKNEFRRIKKNFSGETRMTKYNAKKVTIDGIQFDSKIESQYYLHLKQKMENKEIIAFGLQPEFILQDSFKKNGKTFREIKYIADFNIVHNDGTIEIVDVKGMITQAFAIKKKLFEKRYSHKLTLMKYVKKFGGYITFDEWKKLKRDEKRK